MKTCIIINPRAGSMDDSAMEKLESLLSRLDHIVLKPTEEQRTAEEIARKAVAEKYETIIAAGGDGTLNEVVNGVAPDFGGVRLGILPLGTGNDFARSIGMPDDLDAALEILTAGHTRTLDVVRVVHPNTRFFVNVSAFGFSGQVDRNLTEEMKQSWGPFAYLRSGLETAGQLVEYQTRIAFDDGAAEEFTTYNIVAANARFVGGGIPIAPQAELDDGLIDVIILPAIKLPQLLLVVPQILLGQHMNSDLLIFRRAGKVSIHASPAMLFNVDGELMGDQPVTLEVLPRALHMITPP